ncbi:non-ribosomal peptide synthetase [Bacillus thuringiensis]|uniref:non-ribosomal peptide synthetase n=1 Tax=Bacillus thuringiensis TaxID=1428 RepID=UPI000EA3E799|nr:non-ribosomal peptide synthetase [Bacillus thuringiensis]RKI20810.1 amino acid adenylation domain-containing protein [Bacillus thuringiensis]
MTFNLQNYNQSYLDNKIIFKCEASYAQKRMWILNQLEPDSAAYNVTGTYVLTGNLDIDSLKQSLDYIIQRHESFRTSFVFNENELLQVIRTGENFDIPIIDIMDFNGDYQDLIEEDINTPYNLYDFPLFRIFILKTRENHHVLHINMHHIISDAWSFEIILKELKHVYECLVNDLPIMLSPLSFQYADYTISQNEWIEGEDYQKQLQYWKDALAGNLPDLNLPLDGARSTIQAIGKTFKLTLPKKLCQDIKLLGKDNSSSLYTTMLTAYKILLYKYTEQSDIIVGTPVANRNNSKLDNQVGLYTNTLPLRSKLNEQNSFVDYLDQVKDVFLNAFEHQEIPFDKVVTAINPKRKLNMTPFFQVMFVFRNKTSYLNNLSDIIVTPLEFIKNTSKFDQIIVIEEKDHEMEVKFEYNACLFSDISIEMMAHNFLNLLEEIVCNPKDPISELCIFSPGNIHAHSISNTQNSLQRGIAHLFEMQVDKEPNLPAITFQNKCYSYKELNLYANQLAHYLLKQGIGPESRIGVYCNRSPEMIVGVLGILKCGAAYVPIDSTTPNERIRYMLEDSEVSLTLVSRNLVTNITEIRGSSLSLDFDNWLFYEENETNPKVLISPENLAYIIYTSGSTGRPKGVLIEHKSVIAYSNSIYNAIFKPYNYMRATMNASLAFDASIKQIQLLFHGHCLHIIPNDLRQDILKFTDYIQENKIDVLDCTPSQLKLFIEADLLDSKDKYIPKLILVGGEPINTSLWNKITSYRRISFYNNYGPTECTVNTTCKLIEGDIPTLGTPLEHTNVYILDSNKKKVPPGVVGEIYITGDNLARGYLNQEDLTRKSFINHSFQNNKTVRMYKTGDLGRLYPNGDIEYVGRVDNQVKIRGFRIELEEIEAIIKECKDIRDAIVRVLNNESEKKVLVAYITEKNKGTVDINQVKKNVIDFLPDYMVPTYFMIIDELPLNENGKINHKMLPIPKRVDTAPRIYADTNDNEEILLNVWNQVLGFKEFSVIDNFFDVGGNSLLAAKVMILANRLLKVKFEYRDIFRYPTIRDLTIYLAELEKNGSFTKSTF